MGKFWEFQVLKPGCYLRIYARNSLRIWSVLWNWKIFYFYRNGPLRADLRSKFCAHLRKSHTGLSSLFSISWLDKGQCFGLEIFPQPLLFPK